MHAGSATEPEGARGAREAHARARRVAPRACSGDMRRGLRAVTASATTAGPGPSLLRCTCSALLSWRVGLFGWLSSPLPRTGHRGRAKTPRMGRGRRAPAPARPAPRTARRAPGPACTSRLGRAPHRTAQCSPHRMAPHPSRRTPLRPLTQATRGVGAPGALALVPGRRRVAQRLVRASRALSARLLAAAARAVRVRVLVAARGGRRRRRGRAAPQERRGTPREGGAARTARRRTVHGGLAQPEARQRVRRRQVEAEATRGGGGERGREAGG